MIIAKTIKGKGVSFMENNNDWHHGRLTKKLYLEALKELKKLMLKFQEKENIQWCKLGPRAMFGKFILDIAKIEKNACYICRSWRIFWPR